jgi:hypothetical protein
MSKFKRRDGHYARPARQQVPYQLNAATAAAQRESKRIGEIVNARIERPARGLLGRHASRRISG